MCIFIQNAATVTAQFGTVNTVRKSALKKGKEWPFRNDKLFRQNWQMMAVGDLGKVVGRLSLRRTIMRVESS